MTTWALANNNDYVVVDYEVDFYVDDNIWSDGKGQTRYMSNGYWATGYIVGANEWSGVSAAGNTWA